MLVFCGDDTFESYNQAKLHLTKLASKEESNEVKIIEVDEIRNVNDFLYSLESMDIFGVTPFVFAKRIFENKDVVNYIVENFEKFKGANLIIWHDKDLDKKTKLSKILTKNQLLKSFSNLKPFELVAWIKIQAKELNLNITSETIEFIIQNVSSEKWIILSELKKLQKLESREVTLQIAKEVLGLNIKGDLWKFIDYVGLRNKREALLEFDKLTRYENLSQLIISLLQREFKIITQILYSKSSQVRASELGIPPFALNKALEKSSKFTKSEIKMLVKRLFNLDYSIKSGEIDDKIGIALFLLTI